MSLRTRRKSQTREALIQAVLDQGANGEAFSSMSLRQITKEAGVVPAAFYRHFKDMEDLGKTLVEDYLTLALKELIKSMSDSKSAAPRSQIVERVTRFLSMISERPDYWQFLVAERWGGSPAVRTAIKEQVLKFEQKLARELGNQPALSSIQKTELLMLAHMGANLFFSWIPDWIEIHSGEQGPKTEERLSQFSKSCTLQAQMLFYGAANWKMSKQQTTA